MWSLYTQSHKSTSKVSPADDDRSGVRKAFSSISPSVAVVPTPNSIDFAVVTIDVFSFLATWNHRMYVHHFVTNRAFLHEHTVY